MKFIITEEEKERIKLLYEQENEKFSVFVDNKNPYKTPQYEKAQRHYRIIKYIEKREPQDGDMFSRWTQKAKNNIKKLAESKLLNKSIWIPEQNKKAIIKKIDFELDDFFIPKTMESNLPLHFQLKLEGVDEKGKETYIGTVADSDAGGEWRKNIYNFVKKSLPFTSEFPDDYYEIRKVGRPKTDFQP